MYTHVHTAASTVFCFVFVKIAKPNISLKQLAGTTPVAIVRQTQAPLSCLGNGG